MPSAKDEQPAADSAAAAPAPAAPAAPAITDAQIAHIVVTANAIDSAFGALAILLAIVGVYGVMSWVVGQRTTEFGIRMALGARARDVVIMLLGQSLRPILAGVMLGVLGGFGLEFAPPVMILGQLLFRSHHPYSCG